MVCNRCIMVVESVLKTLNIRYNSIDLGEVQLLQSLSDIKLKQLDATLIPLGFERISDKKSQWIEQIKILIINLIQQKNAGLNINLSDYLVEKIEHDYHSLSHLFSSVEGITIEKFYIAQKIEKAKELLVYDQLTLSEIAFELNYSSVAYLSNQFKKQVGLNPTEFKKLVGNHRLALDSEQMLQLKTKKT